MVTAATQRGLLCVLPAALLDNGNSAVVTFDRAQRGCEGTPSPPPLPLLL